MEEEVTTPRRKESLLQAINFLESNSGSACKQRFYWVGRTGRVQGREEENILIACP